MSRLSRPPSVEPLSDLSWRRIENGLFEELALDAALPKTRTLALRDRRRIWPAAAALAACAAALLVYFATSSSGRDAEPMQSSRIVTADAPSEVSVGDASLVVDSESAILVTTQADRIEVLLERGTVECKVAKRGERPPFVVRVGAVTVEVVGTEFAVTRVGDSAEVEVFEGTVKVLEGGKLHLVHAGERWPAAPVDADDGPIATADDPSTGPGHRLRAAERQRQRRRARREASRARHEQRDAARAEGARGHAERAPETAAHDRPGPRDRYETAAALESSDPAAALALYRELAETGGPWAANALYAQGRLELELGRNAAARRLLQRYLERHPDGANAADARGLLRDLR